LISSVLQKRAINESFFVIECEFLIGYNNTMWVSLVTGTVLLMQLKNELSP
jgi:hypothetical protein